MKVKVVHNFFDVKTKKKNRVGDEMEITDERYEEICKNTEALIEKGKLKADTKLVEVAEAEENKTEENETISNDEKTKTTAKSKTKKKEQEQGAV